MIYTELTAKAMRLAYAAHHGQVDKAGIPYIFHPLHLAEQMEDEISCCAALLHDTVEDTDVTLEQLAEEFPPEVVEAVRLLTHEKGTDYFEYVRAIKGHPVAMKVKLADLAHNSTESRFAGVPVPEGRIGYFRDKYTKAKAILLEE
ncbi:MAG: bifunctional (p)ppGpp synthetase/guanosine-3',5'-bis(diphosphate) 3'-pyrophosphohydrolase [Oscillospiraceae bacterium]|nr:bifunctional (p)ppGpp synthetase/guanosine-3',5'-bis(diphosphate) 3'-pyrophosphohydrolase [Oscillospiraceae bacterium]MBQ7130430.1 bifunctional (p)ppGpp synthetase/guanosine-3',5'-bis(diphosphate) 3'-pyrophosphohydrolase [Oscillospiraceae bacterium]